MPDQKSTLRKAVAKNQAQNNTINKGKANLLQAGKGFQQEFAVLTRDVKKSFLQFIQRWEKFRDIVKNNYELGKMHLGLGNLKDALLRFKFVLWLEPKHVDAMYYLGATYMSMGNKTLAAQWLAKALKARPDFEEAKYLLCVAGSKVVAGQDLPKKMPLSLAVEYFDGLAPDYTAQQIQLMKYEGHIQLDNAIRACLMPGRMDYVILELGVGSGLCGPGLRDVAAHLTGVDISGAMLAEAVKVVDNNQKKIYDALIKREGVEFLKDSADNGYDIVLSAGMFSYMGDLEEVFAQGARVLKDKGLFAFTADVSDNDGYSFDPATARFHFSKSYLQELATRNGLKELRLKDLAVYAEYPAWIGAFQKG